MKRMLIISLLALLFISHEITFSQDAALALDRAYGLDPTLYNGKKYHYYLPIGTKGNQYLVSLNYFKGSVTLKNITYDDVSLNYDIFNQELLLKYQNERGSMNVIEVSKAWIRNFRLLDKYFEYLDIDNNPRYFQVLGEGGLKILYYWRKGFDLDGSAGSYYYKFSDPVRESYLFREGQLKPFSTNRTFIRLFDPALRTEIKSYLHKERIRVRKASDRSMEYLLEYIGKLK